MLPDGKVLIAKAFLDLDPHYKLRCIDFIQKFPNFVEVKYSKAGAQKKTQKFNKY